MAEEVIVNKQWTLQLRDIAKSWAMVVVFPALQGAIELLGKEPIDWANIAKATALATIVFLGQRFAAKPAVVTLQPSNEVAVEVAETIKKDETAI